MSENPTPTTPEKKEAPEKSERAWYDSLVKVVQEFLDFNMITYKEEKTPRLKA